MADEKDHDLETRGASKQQVADGGSPNLSDDNEDVVYDIKEKSLVRKLDLRLLPGVAVLYLLSFFRSKQRGKSHGWRGSRQRSK